MARMAHGAMAHGHGGRLALDRILEHGEERRVALAALELRVQQLRVRAAHALARAQNRRARALPAGGRASRRLPKTRSCIGGLRPPLAAKSDGLWPSEAFVSGLRPSTRPAAPR